MKVATVTVASIEGLFDEMSEPILFNIRNRSLCLIRHVWVNASLHWEKDSRSITLGAGGGIRFCRRCKTIDCFHYWDSEVKYRIEHGKYYTVVHDVGTCRFCKIRVLRGVSGEMKPSDKARELINEVAVSLGKPIVGPEYGSGWVLELPTVVSSMLDVPDQLSGLAAARDFIQQCFRSGDCKAASDILHGRNA